MIVIHSLDAQEGKEPLPLFGGTHLTADGITRAEPELLDLRG